MNFLPRICQHILVIFKVWSILILPFCFVFEKFYFINYVSLILLHLFYYYWFFSLRAYLLNFRIDFFFFLISWHCVCNFYVYSLGSCQLVSFLFFLNFCLHYLLFTFDIVSQAMVAQHVIFMKWVWGWCMFTLILWL